MQFQRDRRERRRTRAALKPESLLSPFPLFSLFLLPPFGGGGCAVNYARSDNDDSIAMIDGVYFSKQICYHAFDIKYSTPTAINSA